MRAPKFLVAIVQSLLWQSGHVGVIVFGIALAALATVSATTSLSTAALLLAGAALLVRRTGESPAPLSGETSP